MIEALQENNQNAFRILVENFEPMIRSIVYQLFMQEEEVEDFTQEVFMKIHLGISGFRKKSSLSTWIYRIALNHGLNSKRKNSAIPFSHTSHKIYAQALESENNILHPRTFNHFVEKKETRKILNHALNKLPKNQRIAFILTHIEDLSYSEVAEIMEKTPKAIDSLTQRAKNNLRKYLAKYYKLLKP